MYSTTTATVTDDVTFDAGISNGAGHILTVFKS